VEQYQNDLKCIESKVEFAKSYYLSSFKSIDFMIHTNPIEPESIPVQKPKLKPTVLFPSSSKSMISPRKLMMETEAPLPKVYVSAGKLLDEIESLKAMSPSKRYSALANSNTLPLPLKYRNLDELFKAMDTVLTVIFKRKERITFNKLKRGVQKLIRK
jgi:chromatin licensing and DNA replication factor 1